VAGTRRRKPIDTPLQARPGRDARACSCAPRKLAVDAQLGPGRFIAGSMRAMEDTMATNSRRSRSTARSSSNGNGSSGAKASAQPRFGQSGPELQRFGTLRLLPIALSAEARTESCQLLNEILADSMVLAALYKKAHWNAAGPTFYQLHLLFDKHYEEQVELVDALAERVQMLGGISVGDPRHAAELTSIPRPPDGAEEVPVVLSRLLDAHETIIEKVRDALDKTEESKDMGSNDLLMGDVLRRHEMQVWFLAEHVVEVPLVEA
jgi:starvation-inducible DNA-binding protein